MTYKKIAMDHDKKIALIAHDNKKQDLIEWAKYDRLIPDYEEYHTWNLEMKVGNRQDVGGYNREIREAQ